MSEVTLSEALEREHRDIDGGIQEYLAGPSTGRSDAAALMRAMAGLRRHIYLEEEFLFPPLKPTHLMPIFVMLREHGELWDAMDALEILLRIDTESVAIPNACRGLLAILDAHNSKEEPIIYPQADVALDPDATDRLREFLASGVMPEGWRCENAALVTE